MLSIPRVGYSSLAIQSPASINLVGDELTASGPNQYAFRLPLIRSSCDRSIRTVCGQYVDRSLGRAVQCQADAVRH